MDDLPVSPNDLPEASTDVPHEWVAEGRIIVFQFTSPDRASVDQMVKFILETMKNWDRQKLYLSIYEAASPRLVFTQHGRVRLTEISAAYPDLAGKSAGVVPFPVLQPALRLFTSMKGGEGRRKRVFANRADAIQWLLEA